MSQTPKTQRAVQLVGPDELAYTDKKPVQEPGPYQILGKVEAVGLCFSDLKLLKQFSGHVRKSQIVSGADAGVLEELPSYVPGEAPTVPGHETVVLIEKVGPQVTCCKVGRRYLVQADYRWLRTATSNGAFGYDLEGGLQEYVLMDERLITSPDGQVMLLPASEQRSVSATALVEPWACVEDAYLSKERQRIKADGKTLVVSEITPDEQRLNRLFDKYGRPADVQTVEPGAIDSLGDAEFDDVIYFGSDAETVEKLFSKVGAQGLFNIVQCGGKFGTDVDCAVGRVHYGGIRIIGTTGADPAESMKIIPTTGEIRPGDRINVVGAGGPMGMMHVIRNICQGVEKVSVYAGDVDDHRLAALSRIAEPIAKANALQYKTYNAKAEAPEIEFDYVALMAPIPALVASAVKTCGRRGIINIFAGIPATVTGEIDLDTYIERQLYFIGTSGSTLDDMKTVLAKVESGKMDTNTSLAAVCGLEAAIEGIRAVENRSLAGKIMVYPACKNLPLTTLEQMHEKMPQVAAKLDNGLWTKAAEQELLNIYK